MTPFKNYDFKNTDTFINTNKTNNLKKSHQEYAIAI